MDELIAFLRARLDEDEAAAKACAGGPEPSALKWLPRDHPSSHRAVEDGDGRVVIWDEGEPDEWQVAHIVRHDPDRVLREVAAKRAILASHGVTWTVVEQLAAVYSGHPDYRQEWKP